MNEGCVIDRLEGSIAVLQRPDESCFEVPRAQLAADVREGDSVVLTGGLWTRDEAETLRRKQRFQQLLGRLNQK